MHWCAAVLRDAATNARRARQFDRSEVCVTWPAHFKVAARFVVKISAVGARGVVHTPQFNGKQEG